MINLSIKIVGKGWAEATINDGEKEVMIIASYLSDGLKNLILSVAVLFEGAFNSSFAWQDEPGEFQWFLSREDDSLLLKIINHERNFAPMDVNNGQVIFESREKLSRFSHRILNEFEKLRLELGERGYKKIGLMSIRLRNLND